jgi:hypothetical protein
MFDGKTHGFFHGFLQMFQSLKLQKQVPRSERAARRTQELIAPRLGVKTGSFCQEDAGFSMFFFLWPRKTNQLKGALGDSIRVQPN